MPNGIKTLSNYEQLYHRNYFNRGHFMRVMAILIFLIIVMPSFGQTFSYPVFKDSGKVVQDFIPANWFLKTKATGDLNGDSIPDLALVIENKDRNKKIKPEGSIRNAGPRILLIL